MSKKSALIRVNLRFNKLKTPCDSVELCGAKKYRAALVPLLLLLLCSCERRPLTYYLESELEIRADWSRCALHEDEESFGATTLFFHNGSTDSKEVLMGTRDNEKVRLPEDTYHAIIFNRSTNGFSSIAFSGERFEEYRATARNVETRTDPQTRAISRVILSTPEELAADVVRDVSVAEWMLGNYGTEPILPDAYTVHFAPLKLTHRVRVEIHLEGINNLRSSVGTVDRVSESVTLSTAQPSPTNAMQQFVLTDIHYDAGSPFNGTLSGEFNVFGFDLESLHTLVFNYLLVDNKTIITQTYRAQAEVTPDESGEQVIYLRIASPDTLPTVKPEGDPDSGFDADVGEWGDPEENEIPLK